MCHKNLCKFWHDHKRWTTSLSASNSSFCQRPQITMYQQAVQPRDQNCRIKKFLSFVLKKKMFAIRKLIKKVLMHKKNTKGTIKKWLKKRIN